MGGWALATKVKGKNLRTLGSFLQLLVTIGSALEQVNTSTELKYEPHTKGRHLTPSEADPGPAQQEFCSSSLIPCPQTAGNTPDLPHPDPQLIFLPCPVTLPAPLRGSCSSTLTLLRAAPAAQKPCVCFWLILSRIHIYLHHIPGMPDRHTRSDPAWSSQSLFAPGAIQLFRVYFYQRGQPHSLGTDADKAQQNRTGNHSQYKNCSFYFRAEIDATLVLLGPFTSPQKCGNIPCS